MALTLFGVAIIVISPFLSTTWPIVVFLLGIAVISGVAYLLAKEAYEKEELSEKALEKPKKIIELPDIRTVPLRPDNHDNSLSPPSW
ncbi:hypothetical protein [Thermococcus piezophilus]|uniref:Uncharacterized protein n=1 Tax=Thermococcus piezophilus TaxID=1712654 RepID=A0A172WHC5_9EURY|nr:hypothetical protein [Thermococcus piezophilus]ANF22716.1 hypothetical protein A7C91_05680 [Thermococcus piezophilus]